MRTSSIKQSITRVFSDGYELGSWLSKSMDQAKPRRWWLPGPPPPRRLISLKAVEESYRQDGTPPLHVPVRHITIRLADFPKSPDLAPYLGRLDQPPTAVDHESVIAKSEPSYLFHGCGNAIDAEVVDSFACRGPSIRFARSRSYFSTGRAVYWSNSIEFAIAWSCFAETGNWDLWRYNKDQPFQCLIFVSRVDLTAMKTGLYLIPKPQTPKEEQALADVSLSSHHICRGRKPLSHHTYTSGNTLQSGANQTTGRHEVNVLRHRSQVKQAGASSGHEYLV